MSIILHAAIRRLLGAVNILAILAVGPCAVLVQRPLGAQQADSQPAKLSPAALDDVVARVALYPDPLLAQVMAASTFVEQISAADQWAAQHRNLKGDALAQAMEGAQLGFDPSVQALLAFPSVLDLMNKDLAWTQALGDATLVQRGDVMDAIQRMRRKAYDAGNLKSSPQITIVQSSPQVIEIQPPSPTIVYVPAYNPQVVYVAPPPPAPGAIVAAAAIGFAVGVALSPSYCNNYWGYHSGFGWSSRTVIVYNGAWGRTWVNHSTYIHTWGGVNRGFYAKPYAYVNTNVYVRKNYNANVNRNVNVNNGNVNVNRNTNVNVNNGNANVNRNTNVNVNNGNTNVNRNTNVNVNKNANANLNTNTNVNANKNTNVNANRNANANINTYGNANVNKSTNANVNNNANANRNSSVNQNVNRGASSAPSTPQTTRPTNPGGQAARGYAPQSSAPSGTFSGVQNGRSEQNAAARGKASRGK
jgi:hypothetical protein